jgi:hypothetical protein
MDCIYYDGHIAASTTKGCEVSLTREFLLVKSMQQ